MMTQQTELFPWFNTSFALIDKAFKAQKLSHGLLINAPKGAGKLQFANQIAKTILCSSNDESRFLVCGECKSCQLFDASTHPDSYLLDRLVDNKGKAKQSIGIDQVRALTGKLSEMSQLGGWKIAIIRSVSDLTTASFNALLKTLEEPGKNTLLLLLADNFQTVPATIKSRTQLIRPELEPTIVFNWLKQKLPGNSDSDLRDALEYASNAPLAAIELLESETLEKQAQLFNAMDRLFNNQLTPEQIIESNGLDDEQLWRSLSNYFLALIKSEMQNQTAEFSAVGGKKIAFQLYDKIIAYQRAQFAGSNLQSKLQIQAILIQWYEYGRKISRISNS